MGNLKTIFVAIHMLKSKNENDTNYIKQKIRPKPINVKNKHFFAFNNVLSFDAVVCKLVCSIRCSLCKSDNILIQAVLSCDNFLSVISFSKVT